MIAAFAASALIQRLIAAMFNIIPKPTFTCAVRLSVPGSDAPVAVQFTFRHKSARELSRWLASSVERASDAELLAEVIDGWAGVAGVEGAAVPYSADNLAALLEAYPAAGKELVLAYHRQLADARAKN